MSWRKQSFLMFDLGFTHAKVADALGIKKPTAATYFTQWRRYPPLFRGRMAAVRASFRRIGRHGRRTIAGLLAAELRTSRDQVLLHMSKPWAMKQIASGEWRRLPVEKRVGVAARTTPRGLRWLRESLASRHVKLIADLAMDQLYDPMDDPKWEVELIAEEDRLFPRIITAPSGKDVTLTFTNEDTARHNFAILGQIGKLCPSPG